MAATTTTDSATRRTFTKSDNFGPGGAKEAEAAALRLAQAMDPDWEHYVVYGGTGEGSVYFHDHQGRIVYKQKGPDGGDRLERVIPVRDSRGRFASRE